MCGIVFVKNSNDKKASKKVFKRYQAQSKRGTQGYGAVSIKDGKVDQVYRSEDEKGIRIIHKDNAPTMLFHHRTPTSTPNLEECTHPIFVTHEELDHDYLVVHNGIISNDTTLKTDFEAKGYIYTTKVCQYYKTKDGYRPNGREVFNDSESLAIDLAIAIEEGTTKTRAQGSIAFIAIQYRRDTKEVLNVYFGRNDRNPLKLDRTGGGIVLASEGAGEDVEPHKLHKLNMSTNQITSRDFDVGLNYKAPATPAYNNSHRASHTHMLPAGESSRYPENYFSKRDVKDKEDKPQMDIVKKKDVPFQKMTLHAEDASGGNHWVDVFARACVIKRTAIDISIASLVTFEEWEEYFKYDKEISGYDDISLYYKEYGIELSPEDYEHMGQEYKRLYIWMGNFTRKIRARAEDKEKTASILDKMF